MNQQAKFTRRRFLTTTAAAGAASLPGFGIAAPGKSINGQVGVAYIGVGGIAGGVLRQFPEEKHIAMCDVDERSAAKNFKTFPDVPRFKDYRRMFDKLGKEIDAVVVSTPDHTHFTAAMEAIERGIHVFVQKPLAHDIWQVRTMKKAADHHKLITQMGNQGHAGEGIRRLKEWYDAGLIGEVKEVVGWFSGLPKRDNINWLLPDVYPPPPTPVPKELAWDLWLGPAADREHTDFYAPKNWRTFWDLGNGVLGDMGCHAFDAPCWILDLGIPASVEAETSKSLHPNVVPDQSTVTYEFPARGSKPPVTMKWYDGRVPPEVEALLARGLDCPKGNGVLFIGEKQVMYASAWSGRPSILMPPEEWKEFRETLPPATIPRVKDGPHKEWMAAIKGEGPAPGSQFSYSARLTELILMGVLAQRAGKRVEWDAETGMINNDDSLGALIKTPPRKGWEYGENY